ncbi:MAG: alpha/beta hydrolase fold domain-containing protein [Gemmataceae bacterium]|nr:alpha/beta hydrolase fold domain-containing protein [Gemmataceae bacterium]MDW8264732.1 alpha/beta hydrolase [Gemmataceae bacterium]
MSGRFLGLASGVVALGVLAVWPLVQDWDVRGADAEKDRPSATPAVTVHVKSPAQPARVNPRIFGLVCAEMITKGLLDEPEYVAAIADLQLKIFLYPGGSASYWHHPTGKGGLNARPEEVKKSAKGGELSRWMEQTSGPDRFGQYIELVKKSRAEALFVANIMHGNPAELDEFLQRLKKEGVPVAAVALGQEMHLSPGVVGLGLDEYVKRIKPHIELVRQKYPGVLIAAPATPVGRIDREVDRFHEWNRTVAKVPGLDGFTQYGWTEFGGVGRRVERRPPEEGWPAYRDFVATFATKQLPIYWRDWGKDKKFLMTQWGTHRDQNSPLQGVHLANMYFFLTKYNAAHNDYFAAATLSIPLAGVEGLSGRQPGVSYRTKVTLYASYLYSKPFRHLFDGSRRLLEARVAPTGDVQALAAINDAGERLLYVLNPGPRTSLSGVTVDGEKLAPEQRVHVEAAFAPPASDPLPVAVVDAEKALQDVVLEPWSLTLLRWRVANKPDSPGASPAGAPPGRTEGNPPAKTSAGDGNRARRPADGRPGGGRFNFQPVPGLTEKEFVYKKTPQGELKLIVTFPPEWKASDRRPGVVFFSGGAWANSLINQFKDRAEYFAGRGMVAARADYRAFRSHQTGPDKAVEDARSAVRWLRAHAAELGLDPNRIAAGGSSAGGHLAACTATPAAPDTEGEDRTISCAPNALLMVNCVADLLGMEQSDKFQQRVPGGKEMADRLSPIRHLGKHTPPTLILDGDGDRWFEMAKTFVDTLTSHGVRAELWIAPGEGHPFSNFSPWREASMAKMDEFLASLGWLQGPPTIQVPAEAKWQRYTPRGKNGARPGE